MADLIYIFVLLEDCFVALAAFFILLYLIIVLCVRRLRNVHNALTLNVFCSIIAASTFFSVYFSLNYFDARRLYNPHLCIVLFYAYGLTATAIQFAFVTFSIHRYFSIVHHTKPFFRRKQWIVMCIAGQWLIQCVAAAPFVLRRSPVRIRLLLCRPHCDLRVGEGIWNNILSLFQYCTLPTWLRIYGYVLTSIVPALINILPNALIFSYVRSSTNRIQPQGPSALIATVSVQHPKVNRREIALVKQMTYMFVLLIVGWNPIFIITVVNSYTAVNPLVHHLGYLLCQVSILGIVLYLVSINQELRQYVCGKIQLCWVHP